MKVKKYTQKFLRELVNEITGGDVRLKITKDTNCYYDWEDDVINFSFGDEQPYFEEFLREKHHYTGPYDDDLFALLHELGHYFCDDDRETVDVDEYNQGGGKEEYYRYYSQPTEFDASEWACQFSMDHPEIYEGEYNE